MDISEAVKLSEHATGSGQAWPSWSAIPKDVREACRWRGVVGHELRLYARGYSFDQALIELKDCLCDASQRVEGMVLREEWVLRPLIVLSPGTPLILIRR